MKWGPYIKPHKIKSSLNINITQSALHRAMPKNAQITTQLHSPHTLVK